MSASAPNTDASGSRRRLLLRWIAVAVLVAVSVAAAGQHAMSAVVLARDGAPYGIDALERFAPLREHVPLSGPEVQVAPGSRAAFVAFLTYADAYRRYDQGMVSEQQRLLMEYAFVSAKLAQLALVPVVVLTPGSPETSAIYDRTRLVVGCYRRAEDVPDLSGHGLEVVVETGDGIVLWRRP